MTKYIDPSNYIGLEEPAFGADTFMGGRSQNIEDKPVPFNPFRFNADLFSSEGLAGLRKGFMEESSIGALYQIATGTDQYGKIEQHLEGMREVMATEPDYSPSDDDLVTSQPLEWRPMLYQVQSRHERDVVISMLQNMQAERQGHQETGAPYMIGAMAGSVVGAGGVTGLIKGSAKKVLAMSIPAFALDELALRQASPIRTNQESVMSFAFGTGLTAAFQGAKFVMNRQSAPLSSVERDLHAARIADDIARGEGELGDVGPSPIKYDDDYVPSPDRNSAEKLKEELNAQQKKFEDDLAKIDTPGDPQPKSAGAAATPAPLRIDPEAEPYYKLPGETPDGKFNANWDQAWGQRMVKTIVGVEKIMDNAVKRGLMGESNYMRLMISHLVEHPNFQLAHLNGDITANGVDRAIATRWVGQAVGPAMRETEEIFLAYRDRVSGRTSGSMVTQRVKDTFMDKKGGLSVDDFLEEVTKAKRALGTDRALDFAPEIVEAAALWDRKVFRPLAEEAKRLRIFSLEHRRALGRLEAEQKGQSGKFYENEAEARGAQEISEKRGVQIEDLKQKIVEADNIELSDNFVNRLYRRDYIDSVEGEKHWIKVLGEHGISRSEAVKARQGILNEIPYARIEEDPVGLARSLKERGILKDVPDQALEPFLENNMFALGRYYGSRMGADVELVNKFGSIDMKPHFNNIKREFRVKRSKLHQEMGSDSQSPLTDTSPEGLKKRYGNKVIFGTIDDGIAKAKKGADGKEYFPKAFNRTLDDGTNQIYVDAERILESFDDKPWRTPNMKGVKPLKDFGSPEEMLDFVINHELKHTTNKQKKGELKPDYENRINRLAQNAMNANIKKAQANVSLTKELDRLNLEEMQTLEDLTVLRDRIRGTFGLPDNPDSWTNRTLRAVRGFNSMTMLTGFMAAIPDVGRVSMHNGVMNSMGNLYEGFFKHTDENLMKMAKADANLAGEAWDDFMALRAALFAGLDDSISVRHPAEKLMGQATQLFFNVSLMNQWNVAAKTMASLVAGSKIYDDIVLSAKATPEGIAARTRLRRAAISAEDANAIQLEFETHGLIKEYTRIGKSHLWTNKRAAEVYQSALGKEINQIIVTPGAGDLPNTIGGGLQNMVPESVKKSAREIRDNIDREANPVQAAAADAIEAIFVSPELSRSIFQFKSFGIAATQRILIPGLQQMDKNFVTGSLVLITLGVMVDQIRREQTGNTMPQNTSQRLMRGVERSGLLGYYSDVGRLLESAYRSPSRAMGDLFGPTVSTGKNLADVLFDYAGPGDVNKTTNKHLRSLMITNNLAHVDWFWDMNQHATNVVTGVD